MYGIIMSFAYAYLFEMFYVSNKKLKKKKNSKGEKGDP